MRYRDLKKFQRKTYSQRLKWNDLVKTNRKNSASLLKRIENYFKYRSLYNRIVE